MFIFFSAGQLNEQNQKSFSWRRWQWVFFFPSGRSNIGIRTVPAFSYSYQQNVYLLKSEGISHRCLKHLKKSEASRYHGLCKGMEEAVPARACFRARVFTEHPCAIPLLWLLIWPGGTGGRAGGWVGGVFLFCFLSWGLSSACHFLLSS